MFKTTITIICTLILSGSLHAQKKRRKPLKKINKKVARTFSPKKTFNIKLNPAGLLTGSPGGSIHFRVSDRASLGLTGNYLGITAGGFEMTGGSVGIAVDFSATGSTFKSGIYISPKLSYIFGEVEELQGLVVMELQSAKTSSFLFGLTGGYQWFSKSGFNLGVGIGAAYIDFPIEFAEQDKIPSSLQGIRPLSELTLGFAF